MVEVINILPRGVDGPGDPAREVQAHRRAIDARLEELCAPFSARVPALGRVMTDAATAPGKRFRAVLMAMLAVRTGDVGRGLIDAACAVEMMHAASLIIDDLPAMDNAQLRRGRPTTHVEHGEGRAILAAIGLVSEAFRTLAVLPGVDGTRRAAMVAALAEAVGPLGLCAGQDLDLNEAKSVGSIDSEQDLKTGQLFDAAFRLVALLQGWDAARTAELLCVSRQLGRAFQSYDDLMDLVPAPVWTGKTAGLDRDASGAKKGLLAVTDADGARRHYATQRRSLDDALSALWFDSSGLAEYIASVLPAEGPAG